MTPKMVRVDPRVANVVCILIAVAASGVRAQGTGRSSNTDRSAVTDDRDVLMAVRRLPIASKVFNATRDVYVWVPAAEGISATRYPVLVFPDAEEKGQFRSALANVQYLINRQLIPPMIVVGVPYFANRRHELTPAATGETAQLYPAAGGADDNLRFMSDELLPWIDAHYPTVPTRILVGHSLGGLFALYAMGTQPDLFRVVVALSPPMWWNDGRLSAELARRIGTENRARTLFLASGGLEPDIDKPTTAFAIRLQQVLDSARGNALRFERRRYPRDIHEMVTLPGLVDGLRMAFAPMVVPTDSIADALGNQPVSDEAEILGIAKRLEETYAASATALGVPAQFPEAPLNLLGAFALQTKHPAAAATLLRENRERYPHSSTVHERLGEALAAIGDTTAAMMELRAALAIAKDSLSTTTSIISRTREQGVTSAAQDRLRALERVPPPLDLSAATSAPTSDSGFTVRRLASGVYAVTRNEPQGMINESNSLFIIGDRDVIVVDAQSSSNRTRETLAALRRITDKPVSRLINTHWHDDHVTGNEVYQAAFPGLEIIGHFTSAEDMATTGVQFRKGAAAAARAGTIGYLKSLAEKKQSFLGGPIDAEEARSHLLSAWLLDDYSNGSADFRPLPPTRTVTDSLTLHQGQRRIEIHFLGRAHTRGDLVVFLPTERILATGDALMWPIEFMGSTSFPGDYPDTEERIRALEPALVVPGHGKVLTQAQADAQAALIGRIGRSLAEQARAAVAKGETLAEAKKHLNLTAEREQMAGANRLRQALFSYYVNDAGFARAYELESAKPKAKP